MLEQITNQAEQAVEKATGAIERTISSDRTINIQISSGHAKEERARALFMLAGAAIGAGGMYAWQRWGSEIQRMPIIEHPGQIVESSTQKILSVRQFVLEKMPGDPQTRFNGNQVNEPATLA